MKRAHLAISGIFGSLGAICARLSGADRDLEFARAVIAQYEIENSRLREQIAVYKQGFAALDWKYDRYVAGQYGRNVYCARTETISEQCRLYPDETCIGCDYCGGNNDNPDVWSPDDFYEAMREAAAAREE